MTTAPQLAFDVKNIMASQPSLEPLQQATAADMQAVNTVLSEGMQSPVPLIPKLAQHLMQAGGKRIRPMLTIAAAQLCGYTGNRHIGMAACVEYIHTATLLHDDVVDESNMRRAAPSANAVWGNKASVLVGDFLFSRAFEKMLEDGSLEVLKILSRAAATIAEGEVLQLAATHNIATTEQHYMAIIRAKTAALFAAACEVGAVVANVAMPQREALAMFGLELGIAYQLVDDAMDYAASQQQLGKAIGNDFAEGKMTLPVILAYQAASAEEKTFWEKCLSAESVTPEALQQAQELLEKYGAIVATLEKAKKHAEKAKQSLTFFAENEQKHALLEAVAFVISRLETAVDRAGEK